jgi:hypothetical protein
MTARKMNCLTECSLEGTPGANLRESASIVEEGSIVLNEDQYRRSTGRNEYRARND